MAKFEIGENGISENKAKIGFFFLHGGLYERLSIEEMIQFTKRLYISNESIEEVIHTVQLDSKRQCKNKELVLFGTKTGPARLLAYTESNNLYF